MNTEDLEKYAAAWNAHDIDTIMEMMTEDCIFLTGGGTDHWGTRFEGADVVRERFVEVWTDIPDVHFRNGRHFAQGDRGCSHWTLCGTRTDGTVVEVDGCDLFEFAHGKIRVKDSYIKIKR